MPPVAEIVFIGHYNPRNRCFSINFKRHIKEGLTFVGFLNQSRYPVSVLGPWGGRRYTLPPGRLVSLPLTSWTGVGTVFCFSKPCRIKLFAGYIVRKGERPIWTDYRVIELGKTMKVEKPAVYPVLKVDVPKSAVPKTWVKGVAHIGTKPLVWDRYLHFGIQNLSDTPIQVAIGGRRATLSKGEIAGGSSPTKQPGWQCNFKVMFPKTGEYEILFLASCENMVWGDSMTWYLKVVEHPSHPSQPGKPSQPSHPSQPKIPVYTVLGAVAAVLGAVAVAAMGGGIYLFGKSKRWW